MPVDSASLTSAAVSPYCAAATWSIATFSVGRPEICSTRTSAAPSTARSFSATWSATFCNWLKSSPKIRSEEHTSELQSQSNLVCRLLLEKKKTDTSKRHAHEHC